MTREIARTNLNTTLRSSVGTVFVIYFPVLINVNESLSNDNCTNACINHCPTCLAKIESFYIFNALSSQRLRLYRLLLI